MRHLRDGVNKPKEKDMAFKITGPGKYLQRDGEVVEIERNGTDEEYPWVFVSGVIKLTWADSGAYYAGGKYHYRDIVSRVEPNIMEVGKTYEDMKGRPVQCVYERSDGVFICMEQNTIGSCFPECVQYCERNGTIVGHSRDRDIRWPEPHKPCPWCGGTNLSVGRKWCNLSGNVYCEKCEAYGPACGKRDTEDAIEKAAWELWDRRSSEQ